MERQLHIHRVVVTCILGTSESALDSHIEGPSAAVSGEPRTGIRTGLFKELADSEHKYRVQGKRAD